MKCARLERFGASNSVAVTGQLTDGMNNDHQPASQPNTHKLERPVLKLDQVSLGAMTRRLKEIKMHTIGECAPRQLNSTQLDNDKSIMQRNGGEPNRWLQDVSVCGT